MRVALQVLALLALGANGDVVKTKPEAPQAQLLSLSPAESVLTQPVGSEDAPQASAPMLPSGHRDALRPHPHRQGPFDPSNGPTSHFQIGKGPAHRAQGPNHEPFGHRMAPSGADSEQRSAENTHPFPGTFLQLRNNDPNGSNLQQRGRAPHRHPRAPTENPHGSNEQGSHVRSLMGGMASMMTKHLPSMARGGSDMGPGHSPLMGMHIPGDESSMKHPPMDMMPSMDAEHHHAPTDAEQEQGQGQGQGQGQQDILEPFNMMPADNLGNQFSSLLGMLDSLTSIVDKSPVRDAFEEAQSAAQGTQVVVIVVEDGTSGSRANDDLMDWSQALHSVQAVCNADFEAICGDLRTHDVPYADHHHHHHDGHSMEMHQDPQQPEQALGFGSQVADKCLRDHLDEVSSDCESAVEIMDGIYSDLALKGVKVPVPPNGPQGGPHGQHPHAMGSLCFLFAIFIVPLCCVCCVIRARHCRRLHSALVAMENNDELRTAIEAAAGTPIPTPGWKCKIRAALDANPELRHELDKAIRAHPQRGFHVRRARRGMLGLVASVLCFVVVIMLLVGASEKPGASNPAFGFFLTILVGFCIIKVALRFSMWFCSKCKRKHGHGEANSTTDGTADFKKVVYPTVPVDPSKLIMTRTVEVTQVESQDYVPPLPVLP